MFDVWHCLHGTERDYTYFSPLHKTYSRIDILLTDKWLLPNISAVVIHTTTWSDQAPITISISDSPQQKNTFLWRANNYILQHSSYSPEITDQITEYFELNTGSVSEPGVVWNMQKAYIRGILIKLSSHHKKQRSMRIDTLISQIANLESQNKANPQPTCSAQLLSLRQELKLYLLHTYKNTQRELPNISKVEDKRTK